MLKRMSSEDRLRLAELHSGGRKLGQLDLFDSASFDKIISVKDEVGNHYLFWHIAGGICQVVMHSQYLGEARLLGPLLQLKRRFFFELAGKEKEEERVWSTMTTLGMTVFSLEEKRAA